MSKSAHIDRQLVFAAAAIVAVGGLIYELLLATAASYIFGDSITSFSITIGTVLFGMGFGSLLASKWLNNSGEAFVWAELLLSVVGGSAVMLLFFAHAYTLLIWPIFISISLIIGACIGLEIPLMVNLVKQRSSKDTQKILSRVLALDYIGALIASLLFPFLLLPYLGLVRTSLLVALINASIALFIARKLSSKNKHNRRLTVVATVVTIAMSCLFIASSTLERAVNTVQYTDPVIYYELTPYQKIALTKYQDDTRLYLNDQLQFSSVDEARYHETLAHIPLLAHPSAESILVLGGGDGLVVREILKHESVKKVTVVDIDPKMTQLASEHALLRSINNDAFYDERVRIVNEDAYAYLHNLDEGYDVVISDLIDPSNERVAKLYSKEFYQIVHARLSEKGVFMTQATSPFFTPNAHQLIKQTLYSASPQREITPYTVNIPSFGEWSFLLASPEKPVLNPARLPDGLKYLSSRNLNNQNYMEDFSPTIEVDSISTLFRPEIFRVYQSDMSRWSY